MELAVEPPAGYLWWNVLQGWHRIMFDEIQILFTSIPDNSSHTIRNSWDG